MLISVYKNYEGIVEASREDPKFKELISNISKAALEELMKLLEPIKAEREKLCVDNKPSLHLVAIVKASLRKMLAPDLYLEGTISELKAALLASLEVDFKVTKYHFAATMLVPRYRSLKMATEIEKQNAKMWLSETLNEAEVFEASEIPHDSLRSRARCEFEDEFEMPVNSLSELERYLELTITADQFLMDPLYFWDTMKGSLPNLCRVAKSLLSVPSTSVSSERSISIAALLLNARRTSLGPERLNELAVLHSNDDISY
jgi:hypothetical protein